MIKQYFIILNYDNYKNDIILIYLKMTNLSMNVALIAKGKCPEGITLYKFNRNAFYKRI